MSAHPWFHSWLVARQNRKAAPRRAVRRPWLRLEQLECRDVPSTFGSLLSTWHFDFGPAGSPVAAGYTAVSSGVGRDAGKASAGPSFGWVAGKVKYGTDPVADPLACDFAQTADATFAAQVAPGRYTVTVDMGGDTTAHDQMGVFLEGAQVDTVSAAANQVVTRTYTVTVTDGTLTLRVCDLGGADPTAVLNGLDIVPAKTPPTATFTGGGPVNEGGTGTVSFAAVTGGTGPYTYSYDFNNDGTFEVAGSTMASATVPALYLADGPATRVVRGRVTDATGAFTDYTTAVAVKNVAPTVSLGGTYSGTVGAPINFAATVTDPSPADAAAGFTYAWSFGDWSKSTQQAPSHTYTTPGTYTVALTILDKDGGVTYASASVTVAAPVTAVFTNGGAVAEGGTAAVSFASPAGGTGPYTYSYDFNNDGVFEVTGSTSASAAVPASYLADGPSARVVHGRVTDAAGAYADYTTSITVTNAPPTVNAGGPYSGAAGAPVSFAATATDPSAADTAAGFTYRWSFGDFGTGTGANPTHTYAAPGTYTVTVTATDKDGGSSTANVSMTVIAPLSGTFANAGAVAEGGTGTVSFANVSGGTGPYTYSYDFNNDGVFEVTGSTQASAAVPASYLADGPSARVVHGRVTDAAGRFGDFTTSITVNNVPPAVTSGGAGQTAVQGVSTSFAVGSFTDPGANDGPWTVAVNWGDGTSTTFTNTLQGAQSRVHTYAAAGTFTITTTVTDKDGGSASATTAVTASTGGPVSSSASFVTLNSATQGTWQGIYGTDGYNVIGDSVSYPAYAQVNVSGANLYTWASSTTDPRALQQASNPANRLAATWYSSSGMTIDINLTDGQTHAVGLYALDWDHARSEQISVLDAATGAVLDTRTLSSYSGGSYLVWQLRGHVTIQVTNIPSANSPNAVVSGLFFGADLSAPQVTGMTPGAGTASVNTAGTVSVTFSKTMDPATITSSTLQLLDSAHNAVAATIAYNPTTQTATLQPALPLNDLSTYTLVVQGGAGGTAVKTVNGVPLGATFSSAFTTGVSPNIVTPYDTIPNFAAHPTVVTARSGAWSDPGTWSTGVVPGAGDIVSILPNVTVTYDANSSAAVNTVAVQNGGQLIFRTDVNTTLTVVNLLVMPGGTLQVGTPSNPVAANVSAQIVFANQALNTTLDPAQYGNGLIGLGTVTMSGAVKSQTFITLAQEAHAGDTTLTLSQPVTGWQAGDKLILPDTRQLVIGTQTDANYSPQWEQVSVQSVSANGTVVTLTAPLQFSHLGARDSNGSLTFMPHVGDLTRNVVVRSQSATGTRGHVLFTYRANVDVRYVQFSGLGRTTESAPDNTTFDASGNVTHIGTNEAGRYPVYVSHLLGPVTAPADGYQFTLVGDSVFCPLTPMTFKWGIALNDSSYGLVQDNVLYNWAGAGLVTESGSEVNNVIQHNFVMRITDPNGGPGSGWLRADGFGLDNLGDEGVGFWFRGFGNYVRDNVAADCGSYGYTYFAEYVGPQRNGVVNVPTGPGSSQTRAVNMNTTPILQFDNNQAYGATPAGMTIWWLGAVANTPLTIGPSVISNFKAWHLHNNAFFGYQTNNLTITGLVARDEGYYEGTAVSSGDYFTENMLITNADIQGFQVGYTPSQNTDGTTAQVIQNSYLNNYFNVQVVPMSTSNYNSDWIPPRTTVIRNVTFGTPNIPDDPSQGPKANINMKADPLAYGTVANLTELDQVFVYDYNGVSGDNFQAYYLEQDPNFVLPLSTFNSDGTHQLDAAPVSNLTNQQAWKQYGVAFAGAVSPTNVTRAGVHGYVRAF